MTVYIFVFQSTVFVLLMSIMRKQHYYEFNKHKKANFFFYSLVAFRALMQISSLAKRINHRIVYVADLAQKGAEN